MSGLAFLPTATSAFRATIAVHIPAGTFLALKVLRTVRERRLGVLMVKGI